MTNIYVGFHDQRNSSRVLKPPGGGTSNIFGTELIPDIIPPNSPRENGKYRGSSIQDVLQTESRTVTTTITRSEEKSSTTNGSVVVVENNESNEIQTNGSTNHEEKEIAQREFPLPDVAAEVICKVDQLKIEERSSKSEVTETDSAGNTKVVLSDSNSEGSVEQNSSVKKGSSMAEILSQDDIVEKKKVKGQPHQRVPPGGYSSGLW